MADVVMPRLSDSMEEGTVLQWLKKVGDEIAVGDELVEIETDKANMAYESDLAGTLTEILVDEGETVAIGEPIARVGDSGASAAGPVAEEVPAPSLGFSPEDKSSLAESEGRKMDAASGRGHPPRHPRRWQWGPAESVADRTADGQGQRARSLSAGGIGAGRTDHQG